MKEGDQPTTDDTRANVDMQVASVAQPLPLVEAAEVKDGGGGSVLEECSTSQEATQTAPMQTEASPPPPDSGEVKGEPEAGPPQPEANATVPAEGMAEQLEDEEEWREYDEAPSLYPFGFSRFAHPDVPETPATSDATDAGHAEEQAGADEAPSTHSPPHEGDGSEEEEEQLDDYGLLQGEVLEGEDCTHHEPVNTDHHYRGLPMGATKRIVLDDTPAPLPVLPPTPTLVSAVEVDVEGRVQAYPEPERKAEVKEVAMDNDAPLELPSNIPLPPFPLPTLPSSASPPTADLSAAALAPQPLLTLPVYTGPSRIREEAAAFEGEVVEGIDATFLPPTSGPTELRGLPRQNRRVVFTDAPSDDGLVVSDTRLPPPPPPPEPDMDTEGDDNASQASSSSHEAEADLEAVFPSPPLPYPVDCSAAAVQADENMSESIDPKYFAQRYRIFSLYDRGCRLDPTAWYSVTFERIALHQAHRIACSLSSPHPLVVIDAFAGVGGNTIAFARHPRVGRVVAVEVDARRLSMARVNAAVYGVEEKIEWVQGKWEEVKRGMKGDVVFLAPPWGGVEYSARETYRLGEVEVEGGGVGLYEGCREVVGEGGAVALNLPRNVDEAEVIALGGGQPVEVEYNQVNYKVKTITAYFGPLVRKER